MNNQNTFFKQLSSLLPKSDLDRLRKAINDEKSIPPKIAVIGKSGVGKTTTINNLFNAKWKTSHTVAGTKNAQRKEFELMGGGKLEIIDMPGLGEDIDTDAEYIKIYQKILPTVDLILYVVQANAKDLSEDQRIINEVVLKAFPKLSSQVVIGLNQVDKIGPGEWNSKLNLPSPDQENSIDRRSKDIAAKLSKVTKVKRDKIVHYSATKRYNLIVLLNAMIQAAGKLGWKLPINPADPFELADPAVQEYIKNQKLS